MFLHGFKFLREVPVSDIDDYQPHIGWISGKQLPFKIYSRYNGAFFYLHDEHLDRLFEFVTDADTKLNRSEQLDLVIEAYYFKYPENKRNM
ncbi:hypothetical protein [Dyadobacter bucti]|uniref:hypothetical protein n=1 Tax=Dyadobacter bucti TaxID=2572203 RepID=UPI0011095671|nr:hypothetical protein [Dyadobacter bucti]